MNRFIEGDVDLLASDEYWDPHAIAGLLKTFMRELPASILTRELHTRFLSVIGGYEVLMGWCGSLTTPRRLRRSPRENKRVVLFNIATPSGELLTPSSAHRSLDPHRSEFKRKQDDDAKCWNRIQPNPGDPRRGV